MRYFKAVGLCLVAVFAVVAVAVASASAETVPTFLFKGVAEGTAEPFTSHTGAGELVVENRKIPPIRCTSATNSGEAIAGTDRAQKIAITFSGCETEVAGKKVTCGTEGTIKSNPLSGELGYIHQGEPLTVGLVLKPEGGAGALFAEFKCTAALTVKVRGHNEGGVVAEVLPSSLNKLIDPGEDAEITFKNNATSPWIQEPNVLTVLGTTVSGLLLEANVGGSGYQLAGIHEVENVKILSSASFEISG